MSWFRKQAISPEQREFNEAFVKFMENTVRGVEAQHRINDAVITFLEAQNPLKREISVTQNCEPDREYCEYCDECTVCGFSVDLHEGCEGLTQSTLDWVEMDIEALEDE